MKILLLLSLLFFSSLVLTDATTFEPRCGDCWCVPGDGESCPDFEPGIWQSFRSFWPLRYTSFQLTSTPLTLQAEDGSDSCYPFAGSVDSTTVNYPEAQVSPCVLPNSTASTTTVCAYLSDTSESCTGREYALQDYESEDAAASAGATMIHSGACGVCSNAQDLAVRMQTIDSIQSQSISCGFEYVLGGMRFDKLTQCYEKLGFTGSCATLWAHFTATNYKLCSGLCIPDQTTNQLVMNDVNQPGCPFTACFNCSSTFGLDFNLLGGVGYVGKESRLHPMMAIFQVSTQPFLFVVRPWCYYYHRRNAYNAGFNDGVAFPCSVFTRVTGLNPCTGSAPTVSPAPSEVTSIAPTPRGGQSNSRPPTTSRATGSPTQTPAHFVVGIALAVLGRGIW